MKLLRAAALSAVAAVAFAQTPPSVQQIAGRLTANDLKAHVSFLASDVLEGRGTPSAGLEIAAEYVAAQFRRAGLELGGDDGYFQTAAYTAVTPSVEGLSLTLEIDGRGFKVDPKSMLLNQAVAADLSGAETVRVAAEGVAGLSPDQTRGKVLLIDASRPPANLAALQPSLVILVSGAVAGGGTAPRRTIRDASIPAPPAPVLRVWDPAVREALAASATEEIRVSAHVPAPAEQSLKLRNVVGVLRGSDPALNDTCLVVSAHYDHLGVRANAEGDRIFNGANDNASGAASLIETANALAALPSRPKRSIVFVALFGEEIGTLGAQYYVRHPVFPLAKTIANINLEQLGRTDGAEGRKLAQFNLTGFDYTTLSAVFRQAAEDAGVQAVKDEKAGDYYFARSDNAAFANVGIPSTTISVLYVYPGYHAVDDEWTRLDYENMARLDCALALAFFRLADSPDAPQWNAALPAVARYIKARQSNP